MYKINSVLGVVEQQLLDIDVVDTLRQVVLEAPRSNRHSVSSKLLIWRNFCKIDGGRHFNLNRVDLVLDPEVLKNIVGVDSVVVMHNLAVNHHSLLLAISVLGFLPQAVIVEFILVDWLGDDLLHLPAV